MTAHDNGLIGLAHIDIGGILDLHDYKPDGNFIMVLPPNFDKWMERLQGRGPMHPEELRNRQKTALTIFGAALEHDFFKFVINDELATCVQEVHALANGGAQDLETQRAARAHAEQLAIDLQFTLAA
jgi:guanylate kinase